jgi:hypothetical protein
MRRPDLVFVGHPRSGSGLINGWLDGHPDIWMAQKELHFFGADLDYNHPRRTLDNYLRCFDGAGDASLVGEASTWLMTSRTAAREIHDFGPDIRIVASIRDPIGWLHSVHGHLLFSANEDIVDFADALAAEPDRAAGTRAIPPYCAPPFAVLYTSLVRYAEQLSRFFEVFGRERVHVVVLDDVKADAAGEYRSLLEFLGARTDFDGFDAAVAGNARSRNSHRTVYSQRVLRFIKRPPQQAVLRRLVGAPPGWELFLRAIRRANIRYADRAPMRPETRAMLADQLRPEVEKVSELLDRDLTHWCAPRR